ncbi:MAG: PDZ domain-containing protein, partial [Selenomonadaceae bacterium]|nr:PDZ domain-containing protein [Selenomonadaceae bacterium]
DVILSVGDKETNRVGDVRNAVLAAKVGDTVKVKLDRDGSTVTVDVVMEAAS